MSDDMNHDVASLRRHLLTYNNGRHAHLAERSDDDLSAAITTAREWVGGRRYSWTIVAKNVLEDGRPHA